MKKYLRPLLEQFPAEPVSVMLESDVELDMGEDEEDAE